MLSTCKASLSWAPISYTAQLVLQDTTNLQGCLRANDKAGSVQFVRCRSVALGLVGKLANGSSAPLALRALILLITPHHQ